MKLFFKIILLFSVVMPLIYCAKKCKKKDALIINDPLIEIVDQSTYTIINVINTNKSSNGDI